MVMEEGTKDSSVTAGRGEPASQSRRVKYVAQGKRRSERQKAGGAA